MCSSNSSEVRIERSLNKNEEEFVAMRRKTVQKSLQKLQINFDGGEVPNIALLGSGGGERAMVGLLGSLVQLQKTGLLDCILYLSGVSGSTWCMASLYQEPDWSTKLETVKDKIIQRLSGPGVSRTDAFAKLKKYYYGKDHFSLTDVWAVMVVTKYVKEIDEKPLTEQWDQERKDPFPIYTVIDKHCKQNSEGDPWFEITPHEAGYSLTGAFVDTSDFGSQFHKGHKIKDQPEIDMLYLQALCGSAIADGDEIKKFLWKLIRDFFSQCKEKFSLKVTNCPPTDEYYQVLMNLVDMNIAVLNGSDPSAFYESIRTNLNVISGGKCQLVLPEKIANLNMMDFTKKVVDYLGEKISSVSKSITDVARVLSKTSQCMAEWIWGRNHNFLHNMKEEAVHSTLLESETRDYIDAGLLLNSPYFSVLRKERDIDLIISLDFSDGDPFMTVKEAAQMCKKLKIPFPQINIPNGDSEKPKNFYVFKGPNAPTVIHIPLFNVVNCGDDIEAWRNKYGTFQDSYSAEMIADLMEVAGKNITNNRAKLLEEIRAASIPKWVLELINAFHTLLRRLII